MRRPAQNLVSILTVVLLSIGLAAPAGALSTEQQKAQVHNKRVQILGQLDVMRASDSQLLRAVNTLNGEVTAQLSVANAALAGVRAARDRQTQDEAAMQATEQRIAQLRHDVVSKAIQDYMRPGGTAALVTGTTDLAEMSRRSIFIQEVVDKGGDAIDQLHGATLDLLAERKDADKARSLADSRQRTADSDLTQLELTRSVTSRMQSSLASRIAGDQAENTDLAAQENSLDALIRQQEAALLALQTQNAFVGGTGVSSEGLIWPVHGPITSPFGPRWGGFHPGLDIGVPIGTPIQAAKAGVVVFSGWMGGYGNLIIIDHGGGFSTRYGHQSRLVAGVGEQVAQGQIIGYSGNTGDSTGPHLHFETRVNGIPENPLNYLP